LILNREHLQQILEHVCREYPYEACGLIGGRGSTSQVVTPVPNISPTPRQTFEMDRRQMVETILRYERAGQEVIGIYHSHPDAPARPSRTDIALASWPDVVWLIIRVDSSQQTEVTAWIIRYGDAKPATLNITP
jgi:proteasome lid subunit RPN8/RPN11